MEIDNQNKLFPLTVGSLLKQNNNEPIYNFHIPSYQRGYRWNTDQIEDLMQDLYDFIFSSNSEHKYCLQPIVVKKMKDGRYEVLDGQQRLTTIYIIINCLKKYLPELKSFSLTYDTREHSGGFLKNIQSKIDESNPDYFYISQAYIIIDKWIKEKKEQHASIASKFEIAFDDNVEFIWYEIIEETDAIEVFTRINIGKIPLTNSELVKSVFLSKNNLKIGFEKRDESVLFQIQNRIANEWDILERKLRDDKFWLFIKKGNEEYDTRVDYILELLFDIKTSNNHYATFRHFYETIRLNKNNSKIIEELRKENLSLIESEWQKIRDLVDILEEWYESHYYYHFIGYLIGIGENLKDWIKYYKNLDREEFNTKIKNKIFSLFQDIEIKKLTYDNDKELVKKLLFLINVDSTYSIPDKSYRFPFDEYKKTAWSIEHIYAQNSENILEKDYIIWLTDNLVSLKEHYNSIETSPLILKIEEILKKYQSDSKFSDFDFFDIFENVHKLYSNKVDDIEKNWNDETSKKNEIDEYVTDLNYISNLTLLDKDSNASLSNSLFDVKRKKILLRDKEGSYIPIETKRVFLKYHTKIPKHIIYWTIEDKIEYLSHIESVINKFKN